jgi:hypothetical protein
MKVAGEMLKSVRILCAARAATGSRRIGVDETQDLLDAAIGGDQFDLQQRVHAVEAGRDGRAGDAEIQLVGRRLYGRPDSAAQLRTAAERLPALLFGKFGWWAPIALA